MTKEEVAKLRTFVEKVDKSIRFLMATRNELYKFMRDEEWKHEQEDLKLKQEFPGDFRRCQNSTGFLCPEECTHKHEECLLYYDTERYNKIREGDETKEN